MANEFIEILRLLSEVVLLRIVEAGKHGFLKIPSAKVIYFDELNELFS
jgi:hypothetical protein